MNKRIKKKLHKRYGFKKYSNPGIPRSFYATILPKNKKIKVTMPDMTVVRNLNNRIYPYDLVRDIMKDCVIQAKRLESFIEDSKMSEHSMCE